MIHRLTNGGVPVSDVFLLSESQIKQIEPFFSLVHGVPRVDDRCNTPQGTPDIGVTAQKWAFLRHTGRTKDALFAFIFYLTE